MTMRLAPPSPDQFTSRLRSPAVAARVGLWLGICFGTCFVTGLISHYAQLPDQPIPFPTSPSWGYRLTQGLHVVTGTAAIPLLLVKLWSVLPKLFEGLPLRDVRALVLTGLERASIAVLVASAIFQLATGLANAAQWYPWSAFSFRTTHYAIAWVAIGALVVHVAVKLPVIRDVLTSDIDATSRDRATAATDTPGVLSRRALVRTTFAAAAVTALATAGSTVPWLRRVSVFAVRTGEGPGGVPINKSARAARVEESATSADWRLEVVVDGSTAASLSYDDLRAMPQHTADLPIACVEGWSAQGTWSGVRLVDLLASAGAPADRDVAVTSLQESGPYRRTTLPANFAADPRTLLALDLSGEPLALDHGYPCRLIAPDRPGVLQTKWLSRLEVST
ncbi:molybdopterin-dependent oxidoreductase [Nocardioides KLBMP 9356]|uniref:Molybdopterin-dependent oxidoreductase n=1 Tax=Nocardioides potassii TaxID=2911371 RepID=A0ABS9H9Z2_9ACTN|nr:molybdopterin-dependent oxidoreductase [Nocardioides potassii]MCF6378025.1 molybdopterin-dependent oxidoreductase [Nocardioides potassii]